MDDHIKGGKKGSKVIEELKNNPDTEELSAVLTSTSHNLPQTAKDCKADDDIEKTFKRNHMIDVVRKNT
ncbi:hypothetical protein [Sphingobacterium faecium]|uniref:hypothetical protein n=1 Tax=Sphingobacterium faecium TaxID=34087 RepID=UPI0024694A50|nr:hypothetical protein [Sphingobacterium faecium]MDH5827026.1 hypothetical protein [Sphingobacterium faecium]